MKWKKNHLFGKGIFPLNSFKGLGNTSAALLICILFTAVPLSPDTAEFADFYRVFIENDLPSTQEIRDSYVNLSTTPFERKELAFSVLVPKDWRDTPLKVSPEVLQKDTENMVPVTLQLAPENEKGNARIEVAYIRMDLETHLSDVVDYYLESNRMNVLMRREGTFNRRKVEEALLYSKPYVVRMTFSRHGDRVFLVSGSAAELEFLRYSKVFAAAAVSFTLQQKEDSPYAEPMVSYSNTGETRLEFRYPEDWHLKEAQGLPSGKSGVDISLVVQDERGEYVKTVGFIHIKGIAKSVGETPDEVFDKLKADFEDIPVQFGRLTLEADLDTRLDAPLAKLKKWDAALSGVPVEISLLAWARSSGYLALGLLTPTPQENRFAWMHAWRVFELVNSDLTGRRVSLAKIKNLTLPSKTQLEKMAAQTMSDFALAVNKENFAGFYTSLAPIFQAKTTARSLLGAFGSFKEKKEVAELVQHGPMLDGPVRIDEQGLLELKGHYPTRPDLTCFELTYDYTQEAWKLMGIRVFMEDAPSKDSGTSGEFGR